jgi:DNA-binding MarR family transcriptional regulator
VTPPDGDDRRSEGDGRLTGADDRRSEGDGGLLDADGRLSDGDRLSEGAGRRSEGAGRLSDGDYQALAAFRHALRRFLRFSETEARARGLAPAQHQLLLAIRGYPGDGAPTIGDIAETLQQRHHSVSELVERAVAAGLVRRLTDADDRRRQQLQLTEGGAMLLEDLTGVHRRELRELRAELLRVLEAL